MDMHVYSKIPHEKKKRRKKKQTRKRNKQMIMIKIKIENASKRLFKLCMKGEWGKVVETYNKDKKVHTAKITRTGDTALHIAVIDGQYDVVRQLVRLIPEEALRIQNERKNTALHLAASMGSVGM